MWYWGLTPGAFLPLSYTPSPIFYFILKQGLARLMRVSLLAEAVLEPVILLSQVHKYWDYERATMPGSSGSLLQNAIQHSEADSGGRDHPCVPTSKWFTETPNVTGYPLFFFMSNPIGGQLQ